MCGIAGILRVWQPGDAPPAHTDAIPEAWLDILDESIKHRGPDGRGRFRQRVVRGDGSVVDVALVHRRLSIIDHADGAQPMLIGDCATGGSPASAAPLAMIAREGAPYAQLPTAADHHTCPKCGDGVVAVVFNGCIYNHRELRRELEAAGHVFHTDHSDTEVLLHGWREWGEGLPGHLDGMFAYGIWDDRQGRLVVARDAFGEKPAYHFAETRGASGPAALCTSAAGLVRLAPVAKVDLIERCDPRSYTSVGPWVKYGWNQMPPLDGLREVAVGSAVLLGPESGHTDDDASWIGWWHEVLNPNHIALDEDRLDAVLRGAVHERLEADVPLGCFLSGGIDSALICKYAAEVRPDLRTFTVRMPSSAYDESDAAAATAAALGVRHTLLDCEPNPAEDLTRAIEQLGLPFGDSSLLPTIWVSRAARSEIKVALSGDGGDELFMGYDRHRVIRMIGFLQSLPGRLKRSLANRIPAARDPKSPLSRAVRLLWAGAGEGYKELTAIFPYPLTRGLGIERRPYWSGHFGMTPPGWGDEADRTVDLARRFDTMFYLPCDLMRKSDTASMMFGLEVRAPMLAREVAKLGIHGHIDTLMPHGQRKGLLRALARRYLPPDIVDRPKMGFAIPIGEWFRTDYGGMRQLLYDHLEAADPFPGLAESGVELNRDFIRQLLREHDAAGERSINPWHGRDHSQRLYMLLVLSIWCRWLRGV